jgi:Na+-translocating ferredoxin:NAD+ oxidoreductase subunit G
MSSSNITITNMIRSPEIAKITLTLVSFYLVIGGIITTVNIYTQPIIKNYTEHKKLLAAAGASQMLLIKKVIPEAESFEEIGKWTINGMTAPYYSVKKGDKIIGYTIYSYGKGYQSLIETFIGLDNNMKITGITVISQAETPGLGEGVMREEFQKQFKGRDVSMLKVTTSGEKNLVQALTGATISSRALTEDAVKNAVEYLKNNIKGH